MAHTLEHLYEIWSDSSNDHLEVGPDRDGLGMLELRSRGPDNKIGARISVTYEEAALVAEALTKLVEEKKQ